MTLEERRDILYAAQHDIDGYRASFDAACKADPVFFINACCWIFDPEARGKQPTDMPFLLRPIQEQFIRDLRYSIDNGIDRLTEKSRSMGATWCVLVAFFWYWLFEASATFLIGTINEDKTDKKDDRSTLFAKLDYLADMLRVDAPWLLPAGYVDDKPTRTFMKMYNPVNDSIITGEAPGTNFGRSGRYKAIFLDEFAAWPFGHSSWTACSLTTRCHLPVSTPKGMSNQFGKLANPKKGHKGIAKSRLYWGDDPTKNFWARNNDTVRPWYNGPDGEAELIQPWLEFWKSYFNFDPVMLAQEIEIDYTGSVEGQIYFNFAGSGRGIYDYNPDLSLYTGWDFGLRDMCAILWIQYNPFKDRHRVIDSFQFSGKPIEWYIPFITGADIALGDKWGGYTADQLTVIRRHSEWEYTDHYGDPAGRQRNPVTATSVLFELSKQGIYVRTNSKANSHEDRINMARGLINRLDVDERYNDNFIEAIENYKWPKVPENFNSATLVNKPVHSVYSHFATALEYYAVNEKHVKQYRDEHILEGAPSTDTVVTGNVALWELYNRLKQEGRLPEQGSRMAADSTGYHRR